jgi:dTDP-4-amino-4,6-dideoxygalactose transaminase
VTEALSKRTIALPFHNHLKEDEIVSVAETLKGILEQWSERT